MAKIHETLRLFHVVNPRRHSTFYGTDRVLNKLKYNKLQEWVGNRFKNFEFVRILGPTAEEVIKDVDLSNKTCLITGANSGIGLEITRCLNAHDCKLLMACRNSYEASVVAKNVCEKKENIKLYELNLASLASVKKCSDMILKNEKKLDIVILNAATFGLPWTLTEDGLETTFQVNYLAQFFLIMTLEGILAPDARVVFTGSESHRNIKWPIEKIISPTLEDISLPREQYTSIKAYNISKLCCLLAMHYLGYRWLNTNISVLTAHPGTFVKTRLSRNWWVYEMLYTAMLPFSKNVEQAASTVIYSAISPELAGLSTIYLKDCQRCNESSMARDTQLSFKLQDLTRDVIRDRILDYDYSIVKPEEIQKDVGKEPVEETFASNYTG
ncbi:unnamed protein product [Pieris brassicae]|uniref:WW domain-containing oxidoreductase n=1 Tax=Pieris brassicae TaxID=7116 RepID=A0A9P0T3J3_PIEBR|nr:unnamed protein product [Pieris brassicae]